MIYTLKNIRKKYKNLILDFLDFDVEEGDILAIVGKNGIGKTTLLKILSLKDFDFDGTLNFNGKNIKNYKKDEFSKDIFFIEQENPFFEQLTVYENIKLIFSENTEYVLNELLGNGFIEKKDLSKIAKEITRHKAKILLTALAAFSEKKVIIVDELFDFDNVKEIDNFLNFFKSFNKTLIFSIACENKDYLFNSNVNCVLDLNNKVFITKGKRTFEKSNFKSFNISLDKKMLNKIFGKWFSTVFFMFFVFLSYTFFNLFYFKAERFKDYFPLFIAYRNKNFEKVELEKIKNEFRDICFLKTENIDYEKFNFKVFYVDNCIWKEFEVEKDYCLKSNLLPEFSQDLKLKYQCQKIKNLEGQFLNENLFVLKYSENFKPNAFRIYTEDKTKIDKLKSILDIKVFEAGCLVNNDLKEAYKKMKKIKPIVFLVLVFAFVYFFKRSIYSKISEIQKLLNYGVNFKEIKFYLYIFYLKAIGFSLTVWLISFWLSKLVFKGFISSYAFNLAFYDFFLFFTVFVLSGFILIFRENFVKKTDT